ncbi:hypothetical protein M2167_002412 [Streptomyces sp. SPB4]|nr:hypothetical protein [Streptomyces sp. SPB4]
MQLLWSGEGGREWIPRPALLVPYIVLDGCAAFFRLFFACPDHPFSRARIKSGIGTVVWYWR